MIGRHGGRSRLGQGARRCVAAARAAALGEGTRLRRRARARLARADDDRAPARHPELDDVRLRVGVAPAPARLPRRDEGRRAGLDPARAARPLRRRAAEARPVPGAEGGVLPLRLRARPARRSTAGRSTRRGCSSCCARRRTCRSTTGTSNPLFPQTLEQLGTRDDVHAVVLPRTEEQREYVRALELPSVIVPERAVDAQSLIAFADLVVSAGGTMNREAAALGVPVYTTYGGRLGGVDEELIRAGAAAAAHRPARARARASASPARACASGGTRRRCSTCCSRPARTPRSPSLHQGEGDI